MAALPAMAEDGVVADITRDMIEWARLSVLTARLSRQSRKGSDFSDVLNTTTATSITKMSLCSSNRTDRTTPRTSKNWLSSRPLLNCSNDTGLAVENLPGPVEPQLHPTLCPHPLGPLAKLGTPQPAGSPWNLISIPWRKSAPMNGFRNFCAGSTSQSRKRFSNPAATPCAQIRNTAEAHERTSSVLPLRLGVAWVSGIHTCIWQVPRLAFA